MGEFLVWLASVLWIVAVIGVAVIALAFVGFVRGRGRPYEVDPWEAHGGPAHLVTRVPSSEPRADAPTAGAPVRRRAPATGSRAG